MHACKMLFSIPGRNMLETIANHSPSLYKCFLCKNLLAPFVNIININVEKRGQEWRKQFCARILKKIITN
jgi:hypothetical protein